VFRGGLPSTEVALARALRPLGYRSVLLGGWHLGHAPPHDPLSHGFDEWLGLPFEAALACA
jgi:arylsulfatase A-like enzyme